MIILTTCRKEALREQTVRQLQRYGITYDMLIMGLANGQRVLINNLKDNNDTPTAIAINIGKDVGMENLGV